MTLVYRSAPSGPAYVTAYRADGAQPAHINVYLEDWSIGLTIDRYGIKVLDPSVWEDCPIYDFDEAVELLAARYAAGKRELSEKGSCLDDSTIPAAHCTWCAETSAYIKKEVLP